MSYGMCGKYRHSWEEIGRKGSKSFSVWESENLTDWSEQRLVKIGNEDFGCLWAPDILYDSRNEDYLLHWSSSHKSNNYGNKVIYYARTKDFQTFTAPEVLYRKEDCGVIDSAIYEEDGRFYMFVKSEKNPEKIILLEDGRWCLFLDYYGVPRAGMLPVLLSDGCFFNEDGRLSMYFVLW